MQRLALIPIALACLASTAEAQIRKAPLSPRVQVEQQVGLAQATLDYGRPGVKGRKIFGSLEPYGMVWRTGANASTKIGFSEPVTLGGQDVPAGTYGLYTIPDAETWTVILSKNARLWGAGGYDPAEDLLRIEVPVTKLSDLQESLLIDFQGFHANGADLVIAWEHSRVSLPVFVDSDERVLAEIDERVRQAKGEVTSQSYFDAGMFLYEKKRDLEEAAKWIDKAVEMRPGAFWQVYYQAELAQHMGNIEKAEACAQQALALAKQSKGGDFGYIAKTQLLVDALEGR